MRKERLNVCRGCKFKPGLCDFYCGCCGDERLYCSVEFFLSGASINVECCDDFFKSSS